MRRAYVIILAFFTLSAACVFPALPVGQTAVPTTARETLTATPEPTVTPAPTVPAAPSAAASEVINEGMLFKTITLNEEMPDPRYTFSAQYPQIEGDDVFNSAMKQLATGELAGFRKNAADAWNWAKNNQPETGSFYQLDYETRLPTEQLITVQFTFDVYSAGAAHPFQGFIALNYDRAQQRFLDLPELFRPEAAYLERLSGLSKQALIRKNRLDFEEGADPAPANFQDWLITPDGLLLLFEPYQIGPYAAGPAEILLPYSDLQDILDPEGPLGDFAR